MLALSDMHAGHALGLFDPETVLVRARDDGSTEEWVPEATETQRWLWSVYQSGLDRARAWADGDPVVVIHGGDATQGTRFGRLMKDVTLADQRKIAFNNLRALARAVPNVTAIRLVTGTEVHVPEDAEAKIAHSLACRAGLDARSFHHHVLDVGGARFDVSHHGPGVGSRDWLRGNVALYYLRDRVYLDRRLGCEPAHVYLTGHYHDFVPVTLDEMWHGERHTARLFVVPSLCGLGDHARKVTRSQPYLTVGMVGIEVTGGRVGEWVPFTDTLDLRTREVL